MKKLIAITIILLFAMPVFCEQKPDIGLAIKQIYVLRYVMARLLIQIITIMETILETDVDTSLKYVARETIEECYAMLQLLEISVERQ